MPNKVWYVLTNLNKARSKQDHILVGFPRLAPNDTKLAIPQVPESSHRSGMASASHAASSFSNAETGSYSCSTRVLRGKGMGEGEDKGVDVVKFEIGIELEHVLL